MLSFIKSKGKFLFFEEIDKELLEYDKKGQIFEEDIYNYYKELQEDE